jgi:hypothetical protein
VNSSIAARALEIARVLSAWGMPTGSITAANLSEAPRSSGGRRSWEGGTMPSHRVMLRVPGGVDVGGLPSPFKERLPVHQDTARSFEVVLSGHDTQRQCRTPDRMNPQGFAQSARKRWGIGATGGVPAQPVGSPAHSTTPTRSDSDCAFIAAYRPRL